MFITNVNSYILQYMSSIIMSDNVRSSSTILFMLATGQSPPPPLVGEENEKYSLAEQVTTDSCGISSQRVDMNMIISYLKFT